MFRKTSLPQMLHRYNRNPIFDIISTVKLTAKGSRLYTCDISKHTFSKGLLRMQIIRFHTR